MRLETSGGALVEGVVRGEEERGGGGGDGVEDTLVDLFFIIGSPRR